MLIKEMTKEYRPREKLVSFGVKGLSDAELLAVLFQCGSRGESAIDLGQRIVNDTSLVGLNSLSMQDLLKIRGIGVGKAAKLICAFELSKRVCAGSIVGKRITCAADIANHYMEKLKDEKREHFIAVFLDTKNRIISDYTVSIGTLNASLVHPREVFKEAIRVSANALILVHNHPSGDLEVSEDDLLTTKKLKDVGKMMGIEVIDHLVVGKNSYYSCMFKKLEQLI